VSSFEEDIAAAVNAFGVQDIGLIWGLGLTLWKSDEERDSFLRAAKNN